MAITDHPDVQRLIKQAAKLQFQNKHLKEVIQSVAKKLREKRIHPLDIIPIERPDRLAKQLEQALEVLEEKEEK